MFGWDQFAFVGDYILTTAIGDSKIFSIVCKSRRDLTERKVDCFVQPNSQHADIEHPFLYTKYSPHHFVDATAEVQ